MFNGNANSRNYTRNGISDLYFKTCEPYKKEIYFKGIWFGNDPTDRAFSIVMLQIILMFLFSRLMYFVLRPLKQPRFICNLLVKHIF
ncbi:hypothetical protein Dsin_001617 [Dipteronia sinensis]|uniref:Uncharacterized protein n=1 Tax=Dipteronia sinensis TaxID=43782 RepID=A0AAE0B493_9ROSI|nr:hypothetical protein Dsin_001617 [Dipteronia sinensis]